ncbi:MAG: hypothetical protein QM722_22740 [Piscinibacter sp.]
MPLRTFLRPNYFFGKQLSVEDFQREQEYHLEKGRLRNRLQFGTGVVAGLRVSVDGQELVVSPGLAFDCQGNELVLAAEHRQPLGATAGRHVVAIRYAEKPVGSVPLPDGSTEPTHIEETVAFEFLPVRPACSCTTPAERLQGCSQPHAVCLATIRLQGTRWRVSSSRGHRRRCG